MADANEDTLLSGGVDLDNTDLADETQDFRFLASLTNKPDPAAVLKRGEKDFESHGTHAQSSTLASSRQAMHDALSTPRLHHQHHPSSSSSSSKNSSLIGYLDPRDHSCIIDEVRGPNLRTLGTGDSRNRLHLLPEECLYLVERGSLNLQWRHPPELAGLPVSLQEAYAYLVGGDGGVGVGLEEYVVYTCLKRSGYVVRRAPTFHLKDSRGDERIAQGTPSLSVPASAAATAMATMEGEGPTLLHRLRELLFSFSKAVSLQVYPLSLLLSSEEEEVERRRRKQGPLVRPGLYRSYAPICAQLSLIPFHDPTSLPPPPPPPTSSSTSQTPPTPAPSSSQRRSSHHYTPLRPTFHIWKPSSSGTFRKSAPPEPNYRVCVLNAREEGFPSLEQLEGLLEGFAPYEPPQPPAAATVGGKVGGGGRGGRGGAGRVYQRIKHGYRSVVLAVVDQGIVNFVRVGEAGVGVEGVWEFDRGTGAAGKGGGGGGGRGGRGDGRRGRGRGRSR